jgi:hypothetical protein
MFYIDERLTYFQWYLVSKFSPPAQMTVQFESLPVYIFNVHFEGDIRLLSGGDDWFFRFKITSFMFVGVVIRWQRAMSSFIRPKPQPIHHLSEDDDVKALGYRLQRLYSRIIGVTIPPTARISRSSRN